MRNVTGKLYYIFCGIFIIFFALMLALFDLNVKEQNVRQGYIMLTDCECEIQADSTAPVGVRYLYSFVPEDVEGAYCQLFVLSSHQEVNIYLEEKCIYRMNAEEIVGSGRSPGHVWNYASFSEQDNGKKVTIEIVPVYKESVGVEPTIYWGNKSDIVSHVIVKALPMIIMSFITIVVGIAYIFFILFNYKKSDAERSLLMLGHFAIQVGLWKLTDINAAYLIFPNNPMLAQVPFLMLMLMCVSFTLFIKELYSTRNHKIWYFPAWLGIANMGLSLMLQYLGIADMRQMLLLTHINILVLTLIAAVMTVYEVRTIGWNTRLKRNMTCMGICFFGAAADMVVYYAFDGRLETVLGMLGFMTYIFVMGLESIKEIKKLMDIGVQARKYEQMAYHDQLTGLFNRTAFTEHIAEPSFVQEKCIIIVMDLNNLKACNDNLGHDKGDIYIKTSAEQIQKHFGDIGRCYRIGGDEFYVLLTNGDLQLCKQRLQAMKDCVATCDIIPGFRMGIACGYKRYDRRMDYDINETARRADKEMYQEKFAMKEL